MHLKALVLGCSVGLIALMGISQTQSWETGPLLFESLQSKGAHGQAIFNRIRYQDLGEKKIWFMQQSHRGLNSDFESWDRLAIVVDQATQSAGFYQLNPGPLEWDADTKVIGLKVSCYQCHSNGPRAIRPNFKSQMVQISSLDWMKVQWLNLKIKLSGPLKSYSPKVDKAVEAAPFQKAATTENLLLRVKTCQSCHNSDTIFGRGDLKLQHRGSIKFMVENGFMPPPGFYMSSKEKSRLLKFVEGM